MNNQPTSTGAILVGGEKSGFVDVADDVKENWERLALRTRQQDPFCCSPNWQLAFHEAYSPHRNLLIRSDTDALIAFAEKRFSARDVYLTPIEPKWFFGNPLLGSRSLDLLAETISEMPTWYAPTFPKILISGLAPNGATLKKIRNVFGEQFRFRRHSKGIQCCASLRGGLDGFLSRRSANQRRNLKKALAKAGKCGLTLERKKANCAPEASKIFKRMVAVERSSWKGIRNCGMVGGRTEEFYRVMLTKLSETSDARVIFAQHEGEDIGYIFGGMIGDIYRGQQFSFDADWNSYSIGNLMQLEQISWLCEEGAARYDMGPLNGHRMEYKSHWTEQVFRIETWVLDKIS